MACLLLRPSPPAQERLSTPPPIPPTLPERDAHVCGDLPHTLPSPTFMGEGMVRAYSDIRAYSYILSFPKKRDEPNPDEPLTVPPCYVCIRGGA